MNRRMKNSKSGFSLVEVVIASLLFGMVMAAAGPILMTGRGIVLRAQRKAETEILGDRAFESIAEGEQQAEVSAGLEERGFELIVETKAMDEEWVYLHVELIEDESVVYEREEVISAWTREIGKETN